MHTSSFSLGKRPRLPEGGLETSKEVILGIKFTVVQGDLIFV